MVKMFRKIELLIAAAIVPICYTVKSYAVIRPTV